MNLILTMLEFNLKGFLVPDKNIRSSIEEFETVFVNSIQSVKRKELFNNYISYSTALKQLCNGVDFKQWIDGSYVTKKMEPNDIDLVTFLDFSIVESLGDSLSDYKYPASQNLFGVDAYIVKIYPQGHKYHLLYQSDIAYWINQFNQTQRNRIGKKQPKGFLEIIT